MFNVSINFFMILLMNIQLLISKISEANKSQITYVAKKKKKSVNILPVNQLDSIKYIYRFFLAFLRNKKIQK